MRRWQFKAETEKDWGDKGPDLLRTRLNARKHLKGDLGEDGSVWYVRTDSNGQWGKWHGTYTRKQILQAFDDWNPPEKTRAQWGKRRNDGSMNALGGIRARVIDVKAHSGCTDKTDQVIALLEAAYPSGQFGGAFVCKQVSGSSTWSQHAYGKAYDHSHANPSNDDLTDWSLRMARENATRDGEPDIQLPVNQVLGSKGGNAGYAENGDEDWIGDFPWHTGGVDDSHEWHVHLSTGKEQSSGTPSCAQKVFETPEDDPHDATDDEDE